MHEFLGEKNVYFLFYCEVVFFDLLRNVHVCVCMCISKNNFTLNQCFLGLGLSHNNIDTGL